MTIDPKTVTFDEMRQAMAEFIQHNPASKAFWDVMTCLRGPDSPSERGDMTSQEQASAYQGRRERKRSTVEVIRNAAFFGTVGGAARSRDDRDYVELPPKAQWDHFDVHVNRAAGALGLGVKIKGEVVQKKDWEIKVTHKEAPSEIDMAGAAGMPFKKLKGMSGGNGSGYAWNPAPISTSKVIALNKNQMKQIAAEKAKQEAQVVPSSPVLYGSQALADAYNNLLGTVGAAPAQASCVVESLDLEEDDLPF